MAKRLAPSGRLTIASTEVESFVVGQLIEMLSDHLIGMWRFRKFGAPREWCITYCVDGDYFELGPYNTLLGALEACRDKLIELNELQL